VLLQRQMLPGSPGMPLGDGQALMAKGVWSSSLPSSLIDVMLLQFHSRLCVCVCLRALLNKVPSYALPHGAPYPRIEDACCVSVALLFLSVQCLWN
jgi:hypothetical protein